MPRTFQGRLTVAFVAVIALTLMLVSVLVINRLDAYFADQQQADLASRIEGRRGVRRLRRGTSRRPRAPVVGRRQHGPSRDRATRWPTRASSDSIADVFGQADVIIRFGRSVPSGEGAVFVPPTTGPFEIPVEVAAVGRPDARRRRRFRRRYVTGGDVFAPYAAEVTLVEPVHVPGDRHRQRHRPARGDRAVRARTERPRVGGHGPPVHEPAPTADRGGAARWPKATLAAASRSDRSAPGSSEIAELAIQFNAMADRVEESVEIIRRDRDRSRDFLADVSHELRTPAGRPADLQRPAQGAGRRRSGRRGPSSSSRAGSRSSGSTGSPRTCSSSRSSTPGLVLLDLRPDDLRAAVETAVEQSTAAARKRGITLRLGLPAAPIRDPPRPAADRPGRREPRRQRHQVHAAAADRWAWTCRATADGARIEVTDTGVGIDPAELPHIFERFYRGSRANEARGSGSGLGLAIVRSIVDMHGGHGRGRESRRRRGRDSSSSCPATRASWRAPRRPNGPTSPRRAAARRREAVAQRDGNFTVRPPAGEPGTGTVGSNHLHRPLTGRHLQGPPIDHDRRSARPDPADPGGDPAPRDAHPRRDAATPATTPPVGPATPPVEPATPVQPSPWSAPAAPAGGSYSPTPETRPDWIRTYEAPTPGDPGALVRAGTRHGAGQPGRDARSGSGTGSVVAAALLAAVLASGGTVARARRDRRARPGRSGRDRPPRARTSARPSP